MAQTRRNRKHRKNRKNRKQSRRAQRQRGGAFYGGLNAVLPITTWGDWASNPAATAWGPQVSPGQDASATQAPPPLANGGLYTAPQSTGAWASSPMPATQHAFALEAAKVSGLPEVAYHQSIAAGTGNSFSPYVHAPLSSSHYSAGIPPQ